MLILQAEQNRTREMLLAAKEKELARKEQEMRKKTAVGEVFTMTDILNQLTKIYTWLSPNILHLKFSPQICIPHSNWSVNTYLIFKLSLMKGTYNPFSHPTYIT